MKDVFHSNSIGTDTIVYQLAPNTSLSNTVLTYKIILGIYVTSHILL